MLLSPSRYGPGLLTPQSKYLINIEIVSLWEMKCENALFHWRGCANIHTGISM